MKTACLIFILIWTSASAQLVIEKSRILFEERKYAEAGVLLNGVKESDKDYGAARYFLGRIAYDQRKYEDAADFFEEATEARDGQVAIYYNWLGNTYGTIAQDANVFRQGMLAPKMKRAWEKAIELDPKILDARYSLISYYTQAPAIMGGSFDKAKEMSRKIGETSPTQGHHTMGNILVLEKKYDEAEREYIGMAKLDRGFSSVLSNFYFNQKKYDKVFALFDEALKTNPADMIAVYQMGKTCALSGQRLDYGEDCLQKYLAHTPARNEPSHAGANMRLAQIYEKKGNRAEAKQKYEAALKSDNSLQEAKDGLARVSKL